MAAIEGAAGLANRIRPVVQVLGGKFMTSPELAAVEAEVGLPPRSLYLRGRSAVLGDVPPKVAAELFGIFPHWLFDFVLPPATAALDAPTAIRAYAESSARWSRVNLSAVSEPGRLAELLFRVIDAADASGLALFAGWKNAERPAGDAERLGFALMVFRELRGGLHFAALRAVGLSVPEAVVADPEGRPRAPVAHGMAGGGGRRTRRVGGAQAGPPRPPPPRGDADRRPDRRTAGVGADGTRTGGAGPPPG